MAGCNLDVGDYGCCITHVYCTQETKGKNGTTSTGTGWDEVPLGVMSFELGVMSRELGVFNYEL